VKVKFQAYLLKSSIGKKCQIGACVALYAAGFNSLDIKHALHWKSDSFLTYLQNLSCQAQRTSCAIIEFNPNQVDIIPGHGHLIQIFFTIYKTVITISSLCTNNDYIAIFST
jgi:hypothetical protein